MYCHKALPFFFYALVKVFDCYTMSEIFMKFLITRTCGYEYYMLDRAAPQQRLWWAAAQDKKKITKNFLLSSPNILDSAQDNSRMKKGWRLKGKGGAGSRNRGGIGGGCGWEEVVRGGNGERWMKVEKRRRCGEGEEEGEGGIRKWVWWKKGMKEKEIGFVLDRRK